MALTLAFDVYGTLIDTQQITLQLRTLVGDKASEFSLLWRNKQLEYSFRRGLMQQYKDFSICTKNALDYTTAYFSMSISDSQKQVLLDSYRTLPAFNDVVDTLTELNSNNHALYAFSNGKTEAVKELLSAANIANAFNGVVSVDDVKSFKPDPKVYSHLLKVVNTEAKNVWLVSSNPFDVIGALSAGIQSIWVQRSQQEIFDPWDIQPTVTVSSLSDIPKLISKYESARQ